MMEPQGTGPDAIGYKGFYYHFLDMKTGRRVWKSEISTIDTTYLTCWGPRGRNVFRPRYKRRARDSPTR